MIIGAGMAGLIAAHLLPRHEIYERCPLRLDNPHKALLRFRSMAVSNATGIEFRPVTVHKGIWLDGEWKEPNIRNANMYSRKVIGKVSDRSIWNLDPAQRWIAPEDFYERLITGLGKRIHWESAVAPADAALSGEPFITTAPMPATLSAVGINAQPSFQSSPIYVRRYKIKGADVHQTVYFPTEMHSLYRASITGDTLICEFTSAQADEGWLADVNDAFAIHGMTVIEEQDGAFSAQQFGKVVPIDEGTRKALITKLTTTFGVYSLGRYATWRNILLDDVVKDTLVIKRLVSASEYERRMYY